MRREHPVRRWFNARLQTPARAVGRSRGRAAALRLRPCRALHASKRPPPRQDPDVTSPDDAGAMRNPLRVGVSALSLLVPHTGIGSYTRNLGNALLAMDDVQARFFYGYGWSPEVRQAGLTGAASLRTSLLKIIPRPYWLMRLGVQQRCFTRGARAQAFNVYHEPAFFPFRFAGTTVITIHDLSPLRHPETHPVERVRQFEKRLPWAAGVAAKIIVDSHFVKREVVELLQVDAKRIHPIHLGVTAEYHPRPLAATASCLLRYGLE